MPPLSPNVQFYALIAVGLIVGALAMIIPLFIACYTFLQRFATKADLAKEIDERKAGDAKNEENSNRRYQENHDRAEKLEKDHIERMGQLESRISREIADNRGNNENRFGEISAKLDALNTTIQLSTNDNSRVIGLLEGKMQLMEKIAQTKLETTANANA